LWWELSTKPTSQFRHNMIKIIADSGSTKCDWALLMPGGRIERFQSPGINPSTSAPVLDEMQDSQIIKAIESADEIHFYGAGIVDDYTKGLVKSFLRNFHKKNAILHVNEDMLAAARACLGNQKGFVGILGTGSNSCFYNGRSTTNILPSLGYLISDEGGGTRLGVAVLKAYFYNQMPEQKVKEFEGKFEFDKSKIIYNLYKTGETNRYIASFDSILDSENDEWSRKIVTQNFREFLKIRIQSHPEWSRYPVHFVGSIAYVHAGVLREVCGLMSIESGEIIKAPMGNLIEYHRAM